MDFQSNMLPGEFWCQSGRPLPARQALTSSIVLPVLQPYSLFLANIFPAVKLRIINYIGHLSIHTLPVTMMNVLNYIGSKNTLLPKISSIIETFIPDLQERQFADLFSGTGSVSFHFQKKCRSIVSNDLEYYGAVIANALVKCSFSEKLENIIEQCNRVEPVKGLIYENLSPEGKDKRMFFTSENAQIGDAIRQHIERLKHDHQVDIDEYHFLLASLLVSIDKVANTTSVYGAFLKKFKKTAETRLVLRPIHRVQNIDEAKLNVVFNDYAEKVVVGRKLDVVYLDPPYTARQYGANYCPLNYIAMYDERIRLNGITGILEAYNKSNFSKKTDIHATFASFIGDIDANFIVMSYSSDGLLSKEQLKDIFLKKGDTTCYSIEYKKFNSGNQEQKNIFEYLFCVKISDAEEKTFSEQIVVFGQQPKRKRSSKKDDKDPAPKRKKETKDENQITVKQLQQDYDAHKQLSRSNSLTITPNVIRQSFHDVLALSDSDFNNETVGMSAELALCLRYNLKTKIAISRCDKHLVLFLHEMMSCLEPHLKLVEHIGHKNQQGDFKDERGNEISLKTNMSGKICPAGCQPSYKKFCQMFNICDEDTINTASREQLRALIRQFLNSRENLSRVFLFCHDRFYTCKKSIVIKYTHNKSQKIFHLLNISIIEGATAKSPRSFLENCEFDTSNPDPETWICKTIKRDGHPIGEFQMHMNRNGVKIRLYADFVGF